jgi:geranylgeranyl diphosphate synthase type I
MTLPSTKTELIADMLKQIEWDLRLTIEQAEIDLPAEMRSMIDHHFGWGASPTGSAGKRIRPLLLLLSCGAAGGDWKQAVPAGTSIELIHNFSLIHDDIQDHSELRRGRPTLWTQWDVSQAINTGDALFAIAIRASLRLQQFSNSALLRVQRILLDSCVKLTEGQHLDLFFENQTVVSLEQYLQMIEGKTASLLAGCTAIGAVLAGLTEDQVEAYRQFGLNLGMAFQINDDILGIWGDTVATGKPIDDDLAAHKKSFPIVYAYSESEVFRRTFQSDPNAAREALDSSDTRQESSEKAQAYTLAALEALDSLNPQAPFDEELRQLAGHLLNRDR